jgi:hypothetical protein
MEPDPVSLTEGIGEPERADECASSILSGINRQHGAALQFLIARIEEFGIETDTKTDTAKNPEKVPRAMTKEARACAREYKRRLAIGEKTPLKAIVSDYVDEYGGSESSILRILQDNPQEWKSPRKTDKKRTS